MQASEEKNILIFLSCRLETPKKWQNFDVFTISNMIFTSSRIFSKSLSDFDIFLFTKMRRFRRIFLVMKLKHVLLDAEKMRKKFRNYKNKLFENLTTHNMIIFFRGKKYSFCETLRVLQNGANLF